MAGVHTPAMRYLIQCVIRDKKGTALILAPMIDGPIPELGVASTTPTVIQLGGLPPDTLADVGSVVDLAISVLPTDVVDIPAKPDKSQSE
jgi:hypothetical protein